MATKNTSTSIDINELWGKTDELRAQCEALKAETAKQLTVANNVIIYAKRLHSNAEELTKKAHAMLEEAMKLEKQTWKIGTEMANARTKPVRKTHKRVTVSESTYA